MKYLWTTNTLSIEAENALLRNFCTGEGEGRKNLLLMNIPGVIISAYRRC